MPKVWHYGFLPGNQQNSLKPTKQQPLPSINYVWDMATSDPTSHDYQITTPRDASVLNHFKPPNTFYLVVLYIKQKVKELEFNWNNTTKPTVYSKGYSNIDWLHPGDKSSHSEVATIIIIIFHETHAAYRLWRGYIHFGIETLCCLFVSPVSYQTFCRGPPLVLFW